MTTSLTRLIEAAFGGESIQHPSPTKNRRKKIWELPARFHCPLVGTCLPVAEMRKLAARADYDEREMNDYTLHVAVVGSCDTRCEIAELIQRYLEKRYAAVVQRFSQVKGEAAVLALWREALSAGSDIPGALWAAWSHADLGEDGSKEIYGDIHMLSHQVGAAVRADLRRLEQLKQENHHLRNEAAAFKMGLAVAKREKDKAVADLQRRLALAEQQAALLGRRELELAEARRQARDYEKLHARAEAMGRRIETLEERNAANARRAAELELRLGEVRDELAAAEGALELALGIDDGVGCRRDCPAEIPLAGRCVLCIGGRTGLVNGYCRLVEAKGGRFLHHDGGQEESLHRIDAIVASADAVICQSGYVSHAAYQRLKEACKKLGKPCVFVQSPGIGSFARGLATLHGEANADRQIRVLSN
jgi:chaperonin cofactor prefoldin